MLEEYLTPRWIILAISLIGFISFYLGKIVLDFYPTKEDKPLNYIVGFILFLTYVLIPILFFYYFPKLVLELSWISFFIFWILYGLLAKYFSLKMDVFKVIMGQADKYFYDVSSKNISKFGFSLENRPKLNNLFKKLFMELPNQLKIILLGYVTIFLIVNLFLFFNNWIIRIFIVIATLSTFNNILVLHNAKQIKYDEVIITDISDKKFNGKLIKQNTDYIILNDLTNIYKFPRENIKSIHITRRFNLKGVEEKIEGVAKIWKKLTTKQTSKKQEEVK